MRSQSIHGDSAVVIQEVLKHCLADGFKPTLAIVFMSVKQDRKAVCEILKNEDIDVLGATSAGEFIDGHQSAGEIAIMAPMEVDKDKNAIKLDFAIPEGGQLQFTLPPDFDIVETVLDNAKDTKTRYHAEADALLVFSCLGRLSALGPMTEQENEGLHQIWEAPMAGFFTYGEYGKGQNDNYKFHSTTCSWVALKEI